MCQYSGGMLKEGLVYSISSSSDDELKKYGQDRKMSKLRNIYLDMSCSSLSVRSSMITSFGCNLVRISSSLESEGDLRVNVVILTNEFLS